MLCIAREKGASTLSESSAVHSYSELIAAVARMSVLYLVEELA